MICVSDICLHCYIPLVTMLPMTHVFDRCGTMTGASVFLCYYKRVITCYDKVDMKLVFNKATLCYIKMMG